MVKKIIEILKKEGKTLAIAESLTGGLVCDHICSEPGASAVFVDGVISYSNESKIKRLGVNQITLQKYSSVSHQTAREMAEGVRKLLNTDIGIATTGVAGPEEYDSDKNPKGLFYVAISIGQISESYKYQIFGDRNQIRNQASEICIKKLLEKLEIKI